MRDRIGASKPRVRGQLGLALTLLLTAFLAVVALPLEPAHATSGVIIAEMNLDWDSLPADITMGPDGNLWFVEVNKNVVGRVTPGGALTEWTIPTVASNPRGVAAGPDGCIWFTEEYGNKIGRITMGGNITEFPLPYSYSYPWDITPGPDGNLWFTEISANRIGRITTAGVISEWNLPHGMFNRPWGITAGADGALWFTQSLDGNAIGRITTDGIFNEWILPNGSSGPMAIAAGPDGALWFTEYDGNRIGRITYGGLISEWNVPTGSSGPIGIAAGPDGALWFTERLGNKLGRITTTGAFHEWGLPYGSSEPYFITLGPDNAMWFTESGGHRVGQARVQYAIGATADPFPMGIITGAGLYAHGQAVNLTAYPRPGYRFLNWTEAGFVVSNSATYSFTATSDRNMVAHFSNQYTIAAGADPAAGGAIIGSGTYTYGQTASLTAAPASGYGFVGWTEGSSVVSTSATYSFTVTSDRNLVAHFRSPSASWYLAEGSTKWGFSCYVSIENPNPEAVTVDLTYMTTSGPVSGGTVSMPSLSQATVFPAATLGAADFSTRVECSEGKAIAVDRTMYWTGPGAPCPEAHCATGVTSPATTWYLPEGSSAWGFECYLLIQNPNPSGANCQVTWMIEGAASVTSSVGVGGSSRLTLNMADFVGAKDASIKVTSDVPVIPERAMYRNNRREGHDSSGTTTAATDYYLAEGCTGFGFTTYVLVQNPQDTPTDVAITYQAASGPVAGPTFTMPPNSRKTVNVNGTTAIPGPDPSFSTRVHGSQPIIAERAMYWNGGPDRAQVCHDSIGLDQPHTSWYLADGQTSEGRETWTLVQNPGEVDVTVRIDYLNPDGAGNVSREETIPANSRRSFNMAQHSGIGGRAAIMVTCTTPGRKIMCERAMYWNNRGTGTDTIGGYAD